MAVFRIERNKGYTAMSNHHLCNKEQSLKSKELLEDWDYTPAGLSHINRESVDAIHTPYGNWKNRIYHQTTGAYMKAPVPCPGL